MCIRAKWLVICALGFLFATGHVAGQETKKTPAAVVDSPTADEAVEESSQVDGHLNETGWPVVLVKPPGDLPWYVQAPVESLTDGKKFSVAAKFGDSMTKPRTKFKVVIIVAKDKRAAYEYETGAQLKALPPGLPRSKTITVSRGE
jgi:hypothetical protein